MDDTSATINVSGPRALFPRPEFRRDWISYDVITPSAARGIFDRIHWRPAMRWIINSIAILNPVAFEEVLLADGAGSRDGLILRDVGYRIDAHFILTDGTSSASDVQRHRAMFRRHAKRGIDVFLGRPDFAGRASLAIADDAVSPVSSTLSQDFGWMVHDTDHADTGQLKFFRAVAIDGVITVPPPGSDLLRS